MYTDNTVRKKSQKMLATFITLVMIMSLFAGMTSKASADDTAKLKIAYGSDTATVTEDMYNSLTPVTATYSSLNKKGVDSSEYTGVKLADILAKANIDVSKLDEEQIITVKSAADDVSRDMTVKELFGTDRYSFTLKDGALVDDDTKVKVDPIITTDTGMLVYGQTGTKDFNKTNWISGLFSTEKTTISVSKNEWDGTAGTGFESGTGTEADPYIISNGTQMAYLSAQVNSGNAFDGKYIKLSKNIDLNDKEFTPIGGGAKLEDGTATYKFKGTFDGNGKTIKNLNINAKTVDGAEPNFTGLFGFNAGTIENLTVIGAVTCTSTEGKSTGVDPTSDFVGSVAGFNCGTIKRVISKVALTALWSGNVGGIAGFNAAEHWRDSVTSDNRTIEGAVGLITECGNEGFIKSYKKIGGIVGETEGTVSKCYNHGNIYTQFSGSGNGQAGIAGRTGCNNAEWGIGHIVNCYNTGAVNTKALEATPNYFDSRWIAGITGFTSKSSTVTNCYTVGTIYKGYKDYCAIAPRGDATTTLVNNYALDTIAYYKDFEGDTARNGIRKTDAEMKAASFLTELGGAYVADKATNVNNGYPILRWQSDSTATVTKVEMKSQPTKTDYVEGQTFSDAGMVLTATYSDGTTQNLTAVDYKISNTDELKPTDTKETVSGTFEGKDFSFDTNITVTENQLDSVGITTAPTKMYYAVGDKFDSSGMKITAKYTNGKTEALTEGFTCTDTALTKGTNTITVSYKYKDTTKSDTIKVEALDMTNAPKQDAAGTYLITGASELQAFSDMVGKMGKTDINAKVTKNIDLSKIEYTPIGGTLGLTIETGNGNKPYYSKQFYYNGTFDGNGSTIKLKTESTTSFTGVVGVLNNGTVKNVITSGSVTSTKSYTGGMVAQIYGSGTVSGCINRASVSGPSQTGGIVGAGSSNVSKVINCKNTAKVAGTSFIGGIIGQSNKTTVTNCINNGDVTATAGNIGGIAGNAGEAVYKCGNTGDISGTSNIGGVAGNYASPNGTADNLYNTGEVKGTYSVGGIYGTGYIKTTTNCFNLGAVTASAGSATQGVGGIVGTQGNYVTDMTNCYNAGIVTGSNGTVKTGSIMGYTPKDASISNTFYLTGTAASSVGGNSAAATVTDNSAVKTSDELKVLAGTLGEAYTDTSGYPQFTWEWSDWFYSGMGDLQEKLEEADKNSQMQLDEIDDLKAQLASVKVASPITVTATANSYNSGKVSWNMVSAAQGYEVYRSTSANGTYSLISKISDPKTVSLSQTGLQCGTTYYYKVRAFNTYSDSKAQTHTVYGNYSEVKGFRPTPAKTKIKTKAGKKKLTVSWKKVKGASKYQVSISTSKKKTKIVKTLPVSKKSYKKTKLKKGKKYYVKVRVYRTVNKTKVYGGWSSIKTVKVK